MAINDEFQWRFGIGPSNSPIHDYAYSAPAVVTAENCEVWRVYLEKLIKRAFSEETMNTAEFQEALEQVRKRKEEEARWRLADERRRERDRRCRVMERPRITYIPKGLMVDYEQEYSVFLKQEVDFVPTDLEDYRVQRRLIYRWVSKSVPQIIDKKRPDAAFAIAMTVCRHLPQFLEREDLMAFHKNDRPHLRKLIVESFQALILSVTAWNNEAQRRNVVDFMKEEAPRYSSYRGLTNAIINLIPNTPFVGEAVPVQREKNDEELRQEAEMERMRQIAEQLRIEAEREARSVIPLNQDIEQRVFANLYFVGFDGSILDNKLTPEEHKIESLLQHGNQQAAALYAMQLIKSICRHFVSDEHYNDYDDWYTPDYTMKSILNKFVELRDSSAIQPEVRDYLRTAWKEIQEEESYKDYGIPSANFNI
jgi:hypothetical protein